MHAKHQFYVNNIDEAGGTSGADRNYAPFTSHQPHALLSSTVICTATPEQFRSLPKSSWGVEFQDRWKSSPNDEACNLSVESIQIGPKVTLREQLPCIAFHLLTRFDCGKTLGEVWQMIVEEEGAGGGGRNSNRILV